MAEDNIFDIVVEETEDSRAANLAVFQNEEQETQVLNYLIDELQLAEDERADREKSWQKFRMPQCKYLYQVLQW